MGEAQVDPKAELGVVGHSGATHIHRPSHGPAGDAGLADMGPGEGILMQIGADPDHQVVAQDAASHVPGRHEDEPAEHLALGNALDARQLVPYPRRQFLAVAHVVH